jgi:undecaprenyl diphosphate synthase
MAALEAPRLPPGTELPRHLAVVMDGNGRWARLRNRPRSFGHRAGAKAARTTIAFCLREGIPFLTLFAFSSENWRRPREEVSGLMRMLLSALRRDVAELARHGVNLRFFGERAALPAPVQQAIREAEARTAGLKRLILAIALNYGGRWDIAQAARTLAARAARGELDPSTIDEALFASALATAGLPDPDLLIRTGGELRLSNFLLWQSAYSELYFTERYWPDVDDALLCEAVLDYARRERRFGRVPAGEPAQ